MERESHDMPRIIPYAKTRPFLRTSPNKGRWVPPKLRAHAVGIDDPTELPALAKRWRIHLLDAIAHVERQVLHAVSGRVEGREAYLQWARCRAVRRRRKSRHFFRGHHELAQQPQGLLSVAFLCPSPQVRCRVDFCKIGLAVLHLALCRRLVV